MAIGGVIRENDASKYAKKVGLFEASVVGINLTEDEIRDKYGFDYKVGEFTGENDEGVDIARIDVWLSEVKTNQLFRVSFYLENRERENKDFTKKQYINSTGVCSWAETPSALPEWFRGTDNDIPYRQAFVGEEELYGFMRAWLSKLDFRNKETVLDLNFKKLMKGDVREIKNEIDGEYCTTVVALATIAIKEIDGEVKDVQRVYNKQFLPGYAMKLFKMVNYSSSEIQEKLKVKPSKSLKSHEKFVLNVIGEYGCKDYFKLCELRDYLPDESIANSEKTIAEDNGDY